MLKSLKTYHVQIVLIAAVAVGVLATSCTRDSSQSEEPSNIKITWKVHDTPPGADPSVPDSLGGTGFEKIAANMGFETYDVSDEELHLFCDPRAKKGGVLRSSISRFPLTFRTEGINSNFVENQMIQTLCYESLIGTHPVTRKTMPGLASHWKISDDKLTFTFRIDPDARFWDGKPVTANDVAATFRLVMDPSIGAPHLQIVFGKFEEPIVLSKYLIQVTAKQLNFRNFLYFGGSLPVHAEHEIGNLTGKEYCDKYAFTLPVGSGAYIILPEDVKNQVAYAFTRRPDYWASSQKVARHVGNFDKIEFTVVKDNPILEYEMFKTGKKDYFTFTALTTDQWLNDTNDAPIKNNWIQKRRVYTQGPWGTSGLTYNMRKPPFDDVRIRKAFAYLFNRERLFETVLFNEYTFTDSYYTNTPYENPHNPKIRYNPELAGKLLDEAGWSQRDAKGLRVKNGKPFVVEFGIPKVIEKFLTPYQQELRNAGIDLQLKYQDGNTLFKNAMERNFALFWMNWGGLVMPNPESSFKSVLADQNNNNNVSGFKNLRVDELIEHYDVEFDLQKQIRIIREIDSIVTNTHSDILGWHPRGIRIGFWDKFGYPEWVFPRHGQFGYIDLYIATLFWHDPDKGKALDEAKAAGKTLPRGSVVVEYWKRFRD